MDLNFEIFMVVLLVLSILVVGNFLRDGESNWLEGALLVASNIHPLSLPARANQGQIVYIIIAIACWYYPDPDVATSNSVDLEAVSDLSISPETLRQLRSLMNKDGGFREI